MEPELSLPTPRSIRLDRRGLLEMAATALLAAYALLVVAAFFSMAPRSLWLDAVFVAFAGLGAGCAYTLAVIWISRVELVRKGVASEGIVVERRANPGVFGNVRYTVWYSADGREWSVEGQGRPEDAEIGEAVTVLYLEGHPEQSLIYRLARCRAVAPQTAAAAKAATRRL